SLRDMEAQRIVGTVAVAQHRVVGDTQAAGSGDLARDVVGPVGLEDLTPAGPERRAIRIERREDLPRGVVGDPVVDEPRPAVLVGPGELVARGERRHPLRLRERALDRPLTPDPPPSEIDPRTPRKKPNGETAILPYLIFRSSGGFPASAARNRAIGSRSGTSQRA